MFAQVAHVIKDVDKVTLPSLVWLERSNQRLDFRWNILRPTPHAVLKINSGFPERECGLAGVEIAGRQQNGLPSDVVEAGSKVLDDLRSKNSPERREWLGQSDFVNFVSAIRIKLNNTGVWLFSEKLEIWASRVSRSSCARAIRNVAL